VHGKQLHSQQLKRGEIPYDLFQTRESITIARESITIALEFASQQFTICESITIALEFASQQFTI
jgi:hypothetical protein